MCGKGIHMVDCSDDGFRYCYIDYFCNAEPCNHHLKGQQCDCQPDPHDCQPDDGFCYDCLVLP